MEKKRICFRWLFALLLSFLAGGLRGMGGAGGGRRRSAGEAGGGTAEEKVGGATVNISVLHTEIWKISDREKAFLAFSPLLFFELTI